MSVLMGSVLMGGASMECIDGQMGLKSPLAKAGDICVHIT